MGPKKSGDRYIRYLGDLGAKYKTIFIFKVINSSRKFWVWVKVWVVNNSAFLIHF